MAENETDEGGEDIEAFLRSLEGQDYVAPVEEPKKKVKVKAKQADERATDAGPRAAPDAPLEKPKPTRKQKKEAKKQAKLDKAAAAESTSDDEPAGEVVVASGEQPRKFKNAARVLKWSAVLLPLTAAWWVLGAYLSNWVSAGWLVLLLATAVVLAVPLGLRMGLKRGRYVWWTAASSTLMVIGLIVPLSASAGAALSHYGHWPASALAEVVGSKADSPIVRANAAIGGWLGQFIQSTKEEQVPRKLGTDAPLNPEPDATPKPVEPPPEPAKPPPVEPTPDPAKPPPVAPPVVTPEPVAPKPDVVTPEPVAPKPDVVTPEPVKPDAAKPAPEAVKPEPEPPAADGAKPAEAQPEAAKPVAPSAP